MVLPILVPICDFYSESCAHLTKFVDPLCSCEAQPFCYGLALPLLLLSYCFWLLGLLLPGVNCTNLLPVFRCNIVECPDLERMAILRLDHRLRNTECFESIDEDWCCKRKPLVPDIVPNPELIRPQMNLDIWQLFCCTLLLEHYIEDDKLRLLCVRC